MELAIFEDIRAELLDFKLEVRREVVALYEGGLDITELLELAFFVVLVVRGELEVRLGF